MSQATAELRERHEAWVSAKAELDTTSPVVLPDEPPRSRPNVLVAVLVVALLPAFLMWDAVKAVGKGFTALVDGLVLLLRPDL